MIGKLKKLGDFALGVFKEKNPFRLNTSLQEATALLLKFTLNENNCTFDGVELMDYGQDKINDLLLKNVKGNAVSEFPTVFYDKGNPVRSLKKLERIIKNNKGINGLLDPLWETFKKQLPEFERVLLPYSEANVTYLLSIEINGQLIGRSDYYQKIKEKALEQKYSLYYQRYNTESRGENAHCYVCGKLQNELWGFVNPFNFYSANEYAYIAGGFRRENSWKNFPVCPDCARSLSSGRDILKERLSFPFYGFRYFLIPDPIMDSKEYDDLIDLVINHYDRPELKESSGKKRERLTNAENEILDVLAEQKNIATFTLLFYEETNSEFKILQEMTDVLPSRFRKLFETKAWVENFAEFKDLNGIYTKNEVDNLCFDFGIIRTFFQTDFNNDFLEVIANIFKGQQLSKSFIIHKISERLAQSFRLEKSDKNKYLKEKRQFDYLKAKIFIKFLYKLNLIEKDEHKMEIKMENKYEKYFQTHPEFYDADWKKAVFLIGVLVQHVMDIQWRDRKATPFRSRLNGLKINYRIVKRLLPESIEKLEQYKSNYYRELEEVIARLMESGEPDLKQQSVDEISFYFAMGMNLNKQFKSDKETEGEDNE